MELSNLSHPAYLTGLATAIGYGIILTVLSIALFAIPYLIFLSA